MNKYIIFDFETTGLYPPKALPVQLSYIILNQDFSVLQSKNFYFLVPYIPKEASAIHGLTVNKLKDLNAKDIKEYKDIIVADFSSPNTTGVSHNITFDSMFYKYFISSITFRGFCTMRYYTPIMKIPGTDTGSIPGLFMFMNFPANE